MGEAREVRAPPGDWEISPQTPMVELLRGGESVTLLVKLRPWKRGDFAMTPVRVFTLFPFGIGRNELGRCRNGLVRVLPRRLLLLDVRLPSQLAGEMHGTFEQYRTGQSMDYIGSRDYFPGDDIRRIDFRSWARLGKPLVREFSAPRSQRIALILDLERRQERICWKKLLWRGWCPDANEAAISLAISVADWLSSRGVELEIRMAGDLDQGWSIAPGMQSIDAFWEELARVKPNRVTALSAVCEPIALDLGRKLAAGIVISSRQQSPPLYLALQNLMQAVPIGRVIRVTNGRSAKNMEPVSGMWTETEIDSREILSQQLQTV